MSYGVSASVDLAIIGGCLSASGLGRNDVKAANSRTAFESITIDGADRPVGRDCLDIVAEAKDELLSRSGVIVGVLADAELVAHTGQWLTVGAVGGDGDLSRSSGRVANDNVDVLVAVALDADFGGKGSAGHVEKSSGCGDEMHGNVWSGIFGWMDSIE